MPRVLLTHTTTIIREIAADIPDDVADIDYDDWMVANVDQNDGTELDSTWELERYEVITRTPDPERGS